MSIDVAQAWNALKSALLQQYPKLQHWFAPPVQEEELATLQEKFGQPLPDEFIQLYRMNGWYDLMCHPDQEDADGESLWGPFALMSIEEVVRAVEFTLELNKDQELMAEMPQYYTSVPADAIKQTYYNPQWLPFWDDGGGNYIGIDLDPGPAGTRGQIIGYGPDENEMWVLENSLAGFLDLVLDAFEAGCLPLDGHLTDNLKAYLQGNGPETEDP